MSSVGLRIRRGAFRSHAAAVCASAAGLCEALHRAAGQAVWYEYEYHAKRKREADKARRRMERKERMERLFGEEVAARVRAEAAAEQKNRRAKFGSILCGAAVVVAGRLWSAVLASSARARGRGHIAEVLGNFPAAPSSGKTQAVLNHKASRLQPPPPCPGPAPSA